MPEYAWPNLVTMFFDQAEKHGDKPFLWAKENGAYQSHSWTEVAGSVSALAGGLKSLGVDEGDRVVLVSENRPEWLIAELAIMSAGAIPVPAYTTNLVSDHTHILSNSGAVGALVSTRKLAENLLPAAHQSDGARFVIGMEQLEADQPVNAELLEWSAILERGRENSESVRETARDIGTDRTAVIIYTSGTGGAPKGVMLSHRAILHNCAGATHALEQMGLGEEVFLSFLPLSHSYEHMAGQFFPIAIGAQIYYAEGAEHLSRNMPEARPTVMTAVPRLYELLYSRITKGVADAGGMKQKLFNKAVELGIKKFDDPNSLTIGERIVDRVVDKLVRDKVRASFGGRLRVLVSGGAPLNLEIGMFFTGLGLKLLQGYGLTESAPLVSVNLPNKVKMHTVGPPVINTEVRIAEDGEILVRGDLVMQGYWQNAEATSEVIRDGWLHTGDVGSIDEDGFIQITDRKKDIIVNSGGDNISPQRVEGILALEPEIAQAMVYGDKRPHLVAILVPDEEFAKQWSETNGVSDKFEDLAENKEFVDVLAEAVDRVNGGLSTIERIRRFIVATEAFTIENEMMTPSLKVRRFKVIEKYGSALEALYR